MTSHILHETEDQLAAINHIICSALEEISGSEDLSPTDIRRINDLFYTIREIGGVQRDLADYGTGGLTSGDEPVTGEWIPDGTKGFNGEVHRGAQRGWTDFLRDLTGQLSPQTVRWIINSTAGSYRIATSETDPRDETLESIIPQLKSLYDALEKNIKSLNKTKQIMNVDAGRHVVDAANGVLIHLDRFFEA